jgi:hypothetical protein
MAEQKVYAGAYTFCSGIYRACESINRDLNIISISECRCDERLKTKPVESTRLGYTGLLGELERLKIKTRLTDEITVIFTV